MSEVTWFKVLTDIFSDDKIKIIQSMPEGDALLVMWFKVLSQAGKTNDGGYIYLKKNIPYTAGMLSTLFGKQQQLVELAMRTFVEFGMIDMDEKGYIFVTHWERHQSIDKLNQLKEKTNLRVQKHREKKKLELMECNVTETLQQRPINAVDLELDLEKKEEEEEEPRTAMDAYKFSFNKIYYTGHIQDYVMKLMSRGFTDAFIREVFMEMGANGVTSPNIDYMMKLAEDWIVRGIYTRLEAQARKEKKTNVHQLSDHKKETTSEAETEKIYFQRWVNAGNDPTQFVYKPTS